jgi:hypothetical protein
MTSRSVDLPDPLGPMIATSWPAVAEKWVTVEMDVLEARGHFQRVGCKVSGVRAFRKSFPAVSTQQAEALKLVIQAERTLSLQWPRSCRRSIGLSE